MNKINKSKLSVVLLCFVILFTLTAACNNDSDQNSTETSSDTTQNNSSTVGESPSSISPSVVSPDRESPNETASSPDAAGRDTISIAISSDPGTLDGSFLPPISFFGIVQCIQEPLWDITDDDEYIWLLATSYEVISDTQWIVHLREGVTFSNGSPFTASDVIFSIKYLISSDSMFASSKTKTIDIDKCAVIDDYTVDLRLHGFNVEHRLVMTDILMYDEETFVDRETASANPIGTGPYVVSEYIVNSYCLLERYDDYWGGTPPVKFLRFRILAEPSQIINALEAGMIDVAQIATQDYEYVNSMPEFNVITRYPANWAMIMFNHHEPSIFANVEARYAICHAIDKNAIINLVYDGMARPMQYASSIECFDHEDRFIGAHPTYGIGYNVELAKQYAERSGLTGREVILRTDGNAASVTMAEIFQNMFDAIGVTVVIHNYDAAGFEAAGRDPTAWDLAIGNNMCPTRNVIGPLVDGIRFSLLRQEGWDGADFIMENGLKCQTEPDDQARSALTKQLLEVYETGCLDYAICETQQLTVFSTDIAGWRFKPTSGLRYQGLYFAT